MIDLEGLTFPKLLPGHRWLVRQDLTSAFVASWDRIVIYILKDRRWFTDLGFERHLYLSDARYILEKADYENIPDDEQELWRMYVMATAKVLHKDYVARMHIPINREKVRGMVLGWQEELNEHLYSD